MSKQGTYIAVDVGGDRVTVASADGAGAGLPRTLRIGHAADAASAAVFVDEDGFVHGDTAAQRGLGDPGRLLRGYTERVGDTVPLKVGGRAIRPEDVLAGVIEWAAAGAAEATTGPIAGVTAVVPAAWGPHRRMQLTAALDARGVRASLVSAPEAVAHAWSGTGTVAVYDLGAHACELTVAHVAADDVAILGTALVDLGGADFDDAIVARVVEHVPSARHAPPLAAAQLRHAATTAKEALTFDAETVVPVLLPGGEHLVRLVRSELESLIEDDILRTVEVLDELLTESGVAVDAMSAIVLVGGSSRIPRVAQLLSEHFPVPIEVDADPQSVAARGAAVAAAASAARVALDAEADAAPLDPAPDTAPAAPRRSGIRRAYDAVLRALTPPVPPAPPLETGGTRFAAHAGTSSSTTTERTRAGV